MAAALPVVTAGGLRVVLVDECDCSRRDLRHEGFLVESAPDEATAGRRFLELSDECRYFAVHVDGRHVVWVEPA